MGDLNDAIRMSLSRLEVLTDLVEFAESRLEVNSTRTASWCDPQTYTKWLTDIAMLRSMIPKEDLEEFDRGRNAKGVRYLQEDGS